MPFQRSGRSDPPLRVFSITVVVIFDIDIDKAVIGNHSADDWDGLPSFAAALDRTVIYF